VTANKTKSGITDKMIHRGGVFLSNLISNKFLPVAFLPDYNETSYTRTGLSVPM
jgi:hypothetical protein